MKTLMDTNSDQLLPPDQVEGDKFEVTQQEKVSTQQVVSKGANRAIILALLLLLVCGILWCVSSMLLTPPQFGPCAFGGVHYDNYIALVKYWSLHLVLGYIVVVARIFVGTQSQDKGTVMFGHFLTVAIVAWILVVILIWYQIFSRLCV
jgi:hypothetical protein